MPPLVRWYVKSAFVYFALALFGGLMLAVQTAFDLPFDVPALGPVYFHLLMVGWVTQLIVGVAYWMFPKQSADNPRGSEALGWAIYITLNLGLALRVVGEPLAAARPESGAGWLLAISAILQLIAGWLFVGNTWGRVKGK